MALAGKGLKPLPSAAALTALPGTHSEPLCASRRYTYGETLGRWRTVDLLIGLAYLARRSGGGEDAVTDIAARAVPMGTGKSAAQLEQAIVSS